MRNISSQLLVSYKSHVSACAGLSSLVLIKISRKKKRSECCDVTRERDGYHYLIVSLSYFLIDRLSIDLRVLTFPRLGYSDTQWDSVWSFKARLILTPTFPVCDKRMAMFECLTTFRD